MKKPVIFGVLFFIYFQGNSQNQRTILLENFIQASCHPSSIYNPVIQNFLDTTVFPVVMINYHTPFPGEDIMNEQNPEDVAERMAFYDVTETPVSIIDGNYFQGGPIGSYLHGEYGWNANTVFQRSKTESVFKIYVNHEFNADFSGININISVTAGQNISGNFTLNVYILENKIEFEEPPGTNGEDVFYSVFKQKIDDAENLSLPANINFRDSLVFSTNWNIHNVFEKEMITVVAFIQNNDTKEVLQTGISEPKAIFQHDAEIVSILEPTANYCNNPVYSSVSPVIKIRNRGGATIDSLIVYSQINNNPVDTNNISLSLGFFKTKELFLNTIHYSSSAPDTISFKIVFPANEQEEDTNNNILSVVFDTVPDIHTSTLYLYIKPDNYGSETSWELRKKSGTLTASGGPYTDYNTDLIIDTLTITENCYSLTFFDSYGDGMNTFYGTGYYFLINEKGDTIAMGGDFKNKDRNDFKFYTKPPIPLFDPEDNAENVAFDTRKSINFGEAIRYLDESLITNPDSLFFLIKDSINGELVSVTWRIWQNKFAYFDDDLDYWTDYYIGFKDGLEDFYDIPIPAQTIWFRTQAEFTKVKSINELNKVLIYPNPVSHKLTIETKQVSQQINSVIIINQYGQKVEEIMAEKRTTKLYIDVTNYFPGVYFLKIKTKTNHIITKFIKIN
ncbi:MAG: T9SS type A sorting domain-containing protein [Chlorobi bacterium]|nr:T9SS type A sorting domain-containing protein [Chlorobiota bacterium]